MQDNPNGNSKLLAYITELSCFVITIVIITLTLYLISIRNIHEFDFWFHLKAGQHIWENGIPVADPFSWLTANKKWIDHSWLFQALLYKSIKTFGLSSVFTIKFILICLPVFIIIEQLLKRKIPLSIIAISLYLPIQGLYGFITLRPHLLSLSFIAILLRQFYLFLDNKNIKYLFPFIILIPLWANIHGYFILGLILMLLLLIATYLQFKSTALLKRISLILIATIVVTCITSPYRISILLYPIKTLFQNITTDKVFFSYIQEMRSPLLSLLDFNKDIIFKTTVIIFFIVILGAKRYLDFFTFATAFLLIGFGFSALRNTIFWFISAPVFWATLLNRWFKNYYKNYKLWLCFCLIPPLSLIVNQQMPTLLKESQQLKFSFTLAKPYPNSFGIEYPHYPIGAVRFLNSIQFQGNILNNLNTGAYLIYSLWPKVKVGIDGRTELYTGKLFSFLLKMEKNADFKRLTQLANKYQIRAILWQYYQDDTADFFLYYLYKSGQWRLAYIDGTTVVFIRNVKQNEKFLRKIPKVSLESFTKKIIQLAQQTSNTKIPIRISKLFLGLEQYQLAINLLDSLPIKQNQYYNPMKIKLICYFRLKQYDKALKVANAITTLPNYKNDRNIAFWKLRCYTRLKNTKKAREIASKLMPKSLWEKQVFIEYLGLINKCKELENIKTQIEKQIYKLTSGLLQTILINRTEKISGGKCK